MNPSDSGHDPFALIPALRQYRQMQGRVVQWWDGVLFFIIGLTTTLSLHVAPSSTRLLWIGLTTMGIGSLLSVLLLILCAVLSLTFTPILLTETTQVHGYPAILVPFWLTGLLSTTPA